MEWLLLVSILLCLIFFVKLLLWFRGLFREPEAEVIPSLIQHLPTQQLLVVLAHPDDEIFITGVLADAVTRGVQIHVITACGGQGGVPFGGKVEGETLEAQRVDELKAHFSLLGVESFEVWDFDDGGMDGQIDEITSMLLSKILELNPDTVLTFDPDSGYTGHPDHVAIGKATLNAILKTKTIGQDSADVCNLVYFLVPQKAMSRFGGQRGRIVAERQVLVQFAVKIDPHLKTRGWRTHTSQTAYLWTVYRIPHWCLYRFFLYEYFFVKKL